MAVERRGIFECMVFGSSFLPRVNRLRDVVLEAQIRRVNRQSRQILQNAMNDDPSSFSCLPGVQFAWVICLLEAAESLVRFIGCYANR